MTISDIGSIGEFVSSIAVVETLIYLTTGRFRSSWTRASFRRIECAAIPVLAGLGTLFLLRREDTLFTPRVRGATRTAASA